MHQIRTAQIRMNLLTGCMDRGRPRPPRPGLCIAAMCGGIRRECVEVKGPGASRARTLAVRTAVNRNRTAFAAIFTLRPCAEEFDANALRLKDPGRRGRGHPRSELQLIGTAGEDTAVRNTVHGNRQDSQ